MAGNGRERVATSTQIREPIRDPQEVARAAYELFERRGRVHGHDLEDWLEAEQIIQARRQRMRAAARV